MTRSVDEVHVVDASAQRCARCGRQLEGYRPGERVAGCGLRGTWRTHRMTPRCRAAREELQGQDE